MQGIKVTTAYKQALKGRILETAMKLFVEQGVKAVKMDDVAQALTISKRTLYELYKDKEELLYQGILQFNEKHRNSMLAFIDEAPTVMDIIIEAHQRRVVKASSINPLFYEDIQKYPRVVALLEKERDGARKQFMGFMRRGVREGYFRDDVDYRLIGELYNAINTCIRTQHLLNNYTMQELFSNLMVVPLRGFCTAKGLEVIENSTLLGDSK
jgi:AcrR family transcriptional regulator